jgi:3-phenylpropionate/cinnamic acid dioxygenase small subunit
MATRKQSSGIARKPAGRKAAARPRSAKSAHAAAPPRVGRALSGGVVIEGRTGVRKTGAQAIAPDHSPREAVRAARSPRTKTAAAPQGDTLREVEQFLYRQAELLDGKYWQDYVDLFTEDGLYWMPVTPDQTEWESTPSIFIEDKALMEIRMGRVTHPNAWSQAPMWATSHLVGHVMLESVRGREIVARSRFHMMELRRDSIRHFGGTYRHTLVHTPAGLRIKLQRVDLFNGQAPYDYVLQVWV